MTSPIALVGSPEDAHVAAVARALEEQGVDTVVVDGMKFPDDIRISLRDELGSIEVEGRNVGHPSAVYVRDIYAHALSPLVDIGDEMEQSWRRTLIALREKAQVMFSILGRWSELGIPVYNPPSPEWRLAKPFQLSLLANAGLPIPETLWTNDPVAVKDFARDRKVIYKPVAGGAATKELGPDDLTDDRLRALAGAPVTFQEFLEGDNYRVYVIDGEVVACLRITSEAIDFRQNEEIVEAATLPDEVLKQCVRATEVVGLRWTGMDLRDDGTGTLKFLELNSSPMFLGFDARAGTDVLGALTGALSGHIS